MRKSKIPGGMKFKFTSPKIPRKRRINHNTPDVRDAIDQAMLKDRKRLKVKAFKRAVFRWENNQD